MAKVLPYLICYKSSGKAPHGSLFQSIYLKVYILSTPGDSTPTDIYGPSKSHPCIPPSHGQVLRFQNKYTRQKQVSLCPTPGASMACGLNPMWPSLSVGPTVRPGFDFLLHLMGQFPQSPHSPAHFILLDTTRCLRISKQLGDGWNESKDERFARWALHEAHI